MIGNCNKESRCLNLTFIKNLNYREEKVLLIGNCNKDSRYLNLTFIKNLDCGEAKVVYFGSARNIGGQLVGVAQIGQWRASEDCDVKIIIISIFTTSTKGRTAIRGSPDRIFRWRRFQGRFEKRRAIMASQEEQKGVGARSITIITLTRKQECLRDSDNGRSY